MSQTHVLWATKITDPDWMETIITEQSDENKHIIEEAKQWATSHGYNRFRVLVINDNTLECPDFTKTINI